MALTSQQLQTFVPLTWGEQSKAFLPGRPDRLQGWVQRPEWGLAWACAKFYRAWRGATAYNGHCIYLILLSCSFFLQLKTKIQSRSCTPLRQVCPKVTCLHVRTSALHSEHCCSPFNSLELGKQGEGSEMPNRKQWMHSHINISHFNACQTSQDYTPNKLVK